MDDETLTLFSALLAGERRPCPHGEYKPHVTHPLSVNEDGSTNDIYLTVECSGQPAGVKYVY